MRLAFFNATRKWGGVKTWTLEFAAALQQLGHTVIVLGREGSFIERALSLGLDARPVRFGPDYNPVAIARFRRLYARERIDAVLVNVGRDLRTAGIAAKLAGLPLVQRIGLPGDMRNEWKVRALHHWLRPHYLCPCRFNRDGLLRNLPCIREEDTTVIHSAKRPAPSAPSHLGRPLRIATTSQLNPDKGHMELMDALSRLQQEGYAFHWDVAGTGRLAETLQERAALLGMEDRITWHGWTQNVRAILAQADVFALPSLSEGLPNTLLEAMAEGLVPVARNVGGIAEIWPEALRDFLVPAYSDGPVDRTEAATPSFHSALRHILSASPETLQEWKTTAWNQCVEAFSMDTQARRLETFFMDLIQTR